MGAVDVSNTVLPGPTPMVDHQVMPAVVDANDKQSVARWIADLLRDDVALYTLVFLELVKRERAE